MNRRSVSGAATIGAFIAFIPIPSQMIISAAAAILLRVNLPLAIAMVWITNPLTIPPALYASFKVGRLVLGLDETPVDYEASLAAIKNSVHHFINLTVSWNELMTDLATVWHPILKPLVVGCVSLGAVAAMAAYMSVNFIWRSHVKHKRKKRLKKMHDEEESVKDTESGV